MYNNGDSGDIFGRFGGVPLAYFLKQSTLKGRTYLAMCETFSCEKHEHGAVGGVSQSPFRRTDDLMGGMMG